MPTPREGYFLNDGLKVPSVTTVIGDTLGWGKNALIAWAHRLGKEGKEFTEVRDRAGDVGTLVHKAIEDHLNGQMPLEQESLPAFDSWLAWWKGKDWAMVQQETALVSHRHGYGGTFDALFCVGDRIVLADWKTSGSIHASYILQLQAYLQLAEENGMPADEGLLLHVPKDGSPATEFVVPYKPELFRVFESLLEVHKAQGDLNPKHYRVRKERGKR